MNEPSSHLDGVRIVVFSRDPSFADLTVPAASAGAQVVHVPTALEALAEMLAEPAVALVVDLRAMEARHRRLLDVAAGCEIEVLAVANTLPPLRAQEYCGARVLGRDQLGEALVELTNSALIAHRLGPAPAPRDQAQTRPSGIPQRPAQPPAQVPGNGAPGQYVPDVHQASPAELPAEDVPEAPSQSDPESPPSDAFPELLSPEELSALLEDER